MRKVEWSRQVKARDGKCMHCGRLEDLHAHHIKPKATHPELSGDVANGITLCYRCHKAEHERTRSPRIRGAGKPQRRTLLKRIAQLEGQVASLEARNWALAGEVARLRRFERINEPQHEGVKAPPLRIWASKRRK